MRRRQRSPAATPWTPAEYSRFADDPLGLLPSHWPDVRFYDRQQQIIRSVVENDETVVVAAHQVGKDFTAGFVALAAFLCHQEARVISTSVKDDHLRVFFGEVGRFIQTSRVPLTRERGGPLVVNHRDIRKVVGGRVCEISYLRGMVSERGEGLAGHHAAYTLLVVDEASGVEDVVFERALTWAKRVLVIGNPYGSGHWFHRAVKGGDRVAE